MNSLWLWFISIAASGCLAGGPLATAGRAADEAEKESLHDPLSALQEEAGDLGNSLFTDFLKYDAAAIYATLEKLAARQGKADATAVDLYTLGQGYIFLLTIHKFYDKNLPDEMPAVFEGREPLALAETGLGFATAYAEQHPDHSDIQRVRGELISFQIKGMMGGMTKGPLAKEAVRKAAELDPKNGWVTFSQARMHFHNPPFVGGDKDLALKEFREVAGSLNRFRVQLYLARAYEAKEMYSQARFWATKALRTAPENPEALRFMRDLKQKMKVEEEEK